MASKLKLLFYFLSLPFILFAQTQDIKFEHISVEQGLSHGRVHSILQDHRGFMWFGTDDGLNKYDGYKFTIYRHDPDDSLSLKSNWIKSLYEDKSGVLWIATMGSGLFKFDHEKEEFIHYNPSGLTCITIEQIAEFRYGENDVLWVGGYNGLFKIDLATQKCTHYPHTDQETPYKWVMSMVVDSSGKVWIGSRDGGLHKFNPETEQYIHYRHDPQNPSSLSNNIIHSLYMDKSGTLWIGTNGGGLNMFDRDRKQFIRYKHDPGNPKSMSSNHLWPIFEDRSGILWVGTVDVGLNRFNRKTEQFTRYQHDPGKLNSLSDNTVTSIYEDKSDVLWIGTYGGLNKFDPAKTPFSEYTKRPGNSNSLCDNNISSVCESNYGGKRVLWIGTKCGLNKLERRTGKFTTYQHDPNNSKSLPSNLILSLFEDRSGILWIGTYADGLIKFDREKEQFTQYLHDSDDPGSINCNKIRCIFEDKYGVLWIGTSTGGLNKLNRETGQFTQLGFKKSTRQVYEDKSGVLWVASWPGFGKLDRESGELITYWRNREASNYPELNRTNSIHESSYGADDVLWIGTYSGLNKFDRKSEKFINYTVKDGLPNNVINGILEDNHCNLWLSTNNGLSRFNPKTEIFRNYDINDGLLSNQFYPGAYFKNKDGEMFFGSAKGLIAFYPDRLRDNSHIPEVVITDFQIFNEPVTVKKEDGVDNNDIYSLPKHISILTEIELSYKENVFSFEFAALDYHSPQKNRYAYMMEGVDPDWVFTDASRRFISYTQLDPGEYFFKVKGSNNDGLWNEESTSIKIIITPPWWKTTGAYASYVLLFALTLYALRTYDLKRQRLKHDLELEHLHAEKLEEVDLLKSRFFANISHEFRTPLTLIKGPVNQMLGGKFIGNVKEQYRMILRNSDRLLRLINQLLDLSKLESGRMNLQVVKTDLIIFIKGLVLSFSSLAECKKITLNFKAPDKSLYGYIDLDKIEKIITNLLSNAFKFTPEGGKIVVRLGRGEAFPGKFLNNPEPFDQNASPQQFPVPNFDFVEIQITNTGPGIPQEQLDNIFDRFYQADTTYKKDGEGTGIGLALTKELVELHRGTIDVECRGMACHAHIDMHTDANTIFTIHLPISREHFKPEEIVEEMETENRRPETGKQMLQDNISYIDTRYQIPDTDEKFESSCRPSASGLQSPDSAKSSPASGLLFPLLLIVEDNPDVTSYIRSFLDQNYRIITAINGKEGWQKAVAKYPDLIISDVMMPEMDGFELCKKIKTDQRTSHIPVILLTAKADLNSKIEGLEFGADDYISKPFEADELKVRSKNLIEQRNRLREKFTRMIEIKPGEVTASSMDEQFLERLITVSEKHLSESGYSTENLAREVGVSRSQLNRKLRALTDLSTHGFILNMRLKRAAQLLKMKAGSVSEVAYTVGFNSPANFSKAFKNQYGKSPRDFI